MSKIGTAYKRVDELSPLSAVNDDLLMGLYDTETSGQYKATVRDLANYITFQNTTIVKSVDDFGETIDSGKIYMIDGSVDMGSTSLTIPEGGINLSGLNGGREVSKIYSTEDNYTMFVGEDAGNVYMTEMSLTCSGANSKLFDITNGGTASFEFLNMNFGGFGASDAVTSMGEVNNYRQGFMSGCGFYYVNDGVTLSGDWGGFVVQDSNVINPDNPFTLLIEGDSLTFSGSVRSNINFLSVDSDSVFTDFQESNFLNKGSFSLTNLRTTADDAIPNISSGSEYARFRNCDGLKNTYVGGQWTISAQATTTISSSDTPVKIAGTTTYSDMQWFESNGNNSYKYIGEQVIEIECKGVVSISGGNNDQASVFFRQYDDSEASYIDAPKSQVTLNGGGAGDRAEGVPFFGYFTIYPNDLIEVWVENNTDSSNITIVDGGLTSVTERAS